VKLVLALSLLGSAFFAPPCGAERTEADRQTERALIERDRQAAEFSRPELRDMPRRSDAEPLRPDERALRAREREAWLLQHRPAPPAPLPDEPPLPLPSSIPSSLPGRPGHGVDPVPVQGPRG
jgi:hypothetical protein